jgi:hypothetical protein
MPTLAMRCCWLCGFNGIASQEDTRLPLENYGGRCFVVKMMGKMTELR